MDDRDEFVPQAERPDEARIKEFESRINQAALDLGFHVVHFTPITRPQRVGYMPWISAHFEQLPRRSKPTEDDGV